MKQLLTIFLLGLLTASCGGGSIDLDKKDNGHSQNSQPNLEPPVLPKAFEVTILPELVLGDDNQWTIVATPQTQVDWTWVFPQYCLDSLSAYQNFHIWLWEGDGKREDADPGTVLDLTRDNIPLFDISTSFNSQGDKVQIWHFAGNTATFGDKTFKVETEYSLDSKDYPTACLPGGESFDETFEFVVRLD